MRKRNCRVQVRLDNKEYQGFMKAVRKSGLSQEVYLRHLINGVVPQDAPPPDYYHFMRELHGVGNNLNQIAKRVNSTGNLYQEDIADLQERYRELWGAVSTLLGKLTDL